jgi:hypothetical protein
MATHKGVRKAANPLADHENAGASLSISTTLDSIHLVEICGEAAERSVGRPGQEVMRLEEATPERLVLSVRTRVSLGSGEVMLLQVQSHTESGGVTHLKTSITKYQTSFRKHSGPTPGQARMDGWPTYQAFMHNFGAAVTQADPDATVRIIETLAS